MAERGSTDPRDAHQRLLRRSMTDESFRQELLQNPKSALERELGTSLPENVEVRGVENTDDTIHLVIPSKSTAERFGELSDEELEAVAGGTYTTSGVATAACSCGNTAPPC
ncbi:MAG: NHLP leader peptide family RiPP precursor [Actinomycetota bacterium]|nr:NHLP leader peptide family RiPP precursor [Actinomycetota bacterium]